MQYLLFSALTATLTLSGCTSKGPSTCHLDKARDGDSLSVTCGTQHHEVRLYCIDAPELAQGRWGKTSRASLQRFTGQSIKLNIQDKDRYGRLVAEVTNAEGINLNLTQLESGQAAMYHRYCKRKDYQTAEQKARQSQRGIWSKPGEQQRPWNYRRKHPRR